MEAPMRELIDVIRGAVAEGATAEAKAAGAATINYGVFLNAVVDFLIVAFVIFLLIRQVNRFKGPVEPEAPRTRECPECLSMVPALAHRCAACTSVLPPPTVAIV
jgi:large conductance mechanosensitive channel